MSAPMAVKLPWQKVTPLHGLGTRLMARSMFSTLRMIRPTPRIGDSGGSSGCSASFTPFASATGTTRSVNHAKFSQSRSSLISSPSAPGVRPSAAARPRASIAAWS